MTLREDTNSAPCLLAIARFEGPREQSERFQKELTEAIQAHWSSGELRKVIRPWSKRLGVDSPAQRICQQQGLGALLFGRLGGEGFDAHIVFSTGRRLTHIDSWSRDTTSIVKRNPIEPVPSRTRLKADTEERLVQGLVAYLHASLARAVAGAPQAPAADFRPRLPDSDDELTAMICCLQAEVLQVTQGTDVALAWVNHGLERLKSPRLLHTSFRLLYEGRREELFSEGSETNHLAIQVLKEAAEFTDDPEYPQALYNLLQVLPDNNDPELFEEQLRILDLLNEDPTYRRAWWIERMRGSLHYRIATRQRAFSGDDSARDEFAKAARSYSKALRLRHRSRVEESELGPVAPAHIPRSPVLQANAYDAHHYAGNRLRAAWHHRRTQRVVGRLFKYGVRAMIATDFVTALRMFDLQLAVGWSDPMAARASVMATFVSEELGDTVEAENYWRRALEIDEIVARTAAMEMGAGEFRKRLGEDEGNDRKVNR